MESERAYVKVLQFDTPGDPNVHAMRVMAQVRGGGGREEG